MIPVLMAATALCIFGAIAAFATASFGALTLCVFGAAIGLVLLAGIDE